MAEVVLDASALLALLNDEPGADIVASVLAASAISTLNLSEVVGKLADVGMPATAIREALRDFPLEVVPFDEEQAYEAGLMRPATKGAGLSLGDRACLSLAHRLGLPALTTDRNWKHLQVDVKVSIIR